VSKSQGNYLINRDIASKRILELDVTIEATLFLSGPCSRECDHTAEPLHKKNFNQRLSYTYEMRQAKNGVLLYVHVKAGAYKDNVIGFENNALKVSVRSVREKGRANEAVLELLAEYFEIAKSRIEIQSGATSKIKRILLLECSLEAISKRMLL